MFRGNKRAMLIAAVALLALIVGVSSVLIVQDQNRRPATVAKDILPADSALLTDQRAIKDGVNQSNTQNALNIARHYIGIKQYQSAREMAEKVDDSWANNSQLVSKHVTILDSYRLTNDKTGFTGAVDRFRTVLLARNDPQLKYTADGLTQAYIDASFAADEGSTEESF